MQISALPQATAQRVANLKATPLSNGPAATRSNAVSSRVTAQTISSMQRQSDTSLRSRTQLPTIAGSPSVGTAGSNSQISREMKERDHLPSSGANGTSVNPKETPTKRYWTSVTHRKPHSLRSRNGSLPVHLLHQAPHLGFHVRCLIRPQRPTSHAKATVIPCLLVAFGNHPLALWLHSTRLLPATHPQPRRRHIVSLPSRRRRVSNY